MIRLWHRFVCLASVWVQLSQPDFAYCWAYAFLFRANHHVSMPASSRICLHGNYVIRPSRLAGPTTFPSIPHTLLDRCLTVWVKWRHLLVRRWTFVVELFVVVSSWLILVLSGSALQINLLLLVWCSTSFVAGPLAFMWSVGNTDNFSLNNFRKTPFWSTFFSFSL